MNCAVCDKGEPPSRWGESQRPTQTLKAEGQHLHFPGRPWGELLAEGLARAQEVQVVEYRWV